MRGSRTMLTRDIASRKSSAQRNFDLVSISGIGVSVIGARVIIAL